jgi:hypothetical protein
MPCDLRNARVAELGAEVWPASKGMSLRDWFAGQALAALISKAPFFDRDSEHGHPIVDMLQFKADMAVSAYGYADALLSAREATLSPTSATTPPNRRRPND